MLKSKKIAEREKFLNLGAAFDDPGFILCYNNELALETYEKIILCEDGEMLTTNCPVGLLLGENWRCWSLRSPTYNIEIAYDPRSKTINEWWEKLMEIMGSSNQKHMHVKHMKGTLVIFTFGRPLLWNELVLRRELINWLVSRYRWQQSYNFCHPSNK